jgi:hypothetical protein
MSELSGEGPVDTSTPFLETNTALKESRIKRQRIYIDINMTVGISGKDMELRTSISVM